jgi:hypothetical protein
MLQLLEGLEEGIEQQQGWTVVQNAHAPVASDCTVLSIDPPVPPVKRYTPVSNSCCSTFLR